MLVLFSTFANAQTFSNTTKKPCGDNFGSTWGSFSRNIEVSGLPTTGLSESGKVLREVRVQLGTKDCKGNLSSYAMRIKNPQGVTVVLASPITTSGASMWININFRDDPSLERVEEYPTIVQQNYFPFSIGYYALETDGDFAKFNTGADPNGNWVFEVIENTVSEVSFEKVELVFGSAICVADYTPDVANNSCSEATCISNGVYKGGNNGYSELDPQFPGLTVDGCAWNGANNNSAWFQFVPTSTSARITISGMLNLTNIGSNDMQPIVLKANGNCLKPIEVPTGGCPDDESINNKTYASAFGGGVGVSGNVYSNGISANCEFNLSGLTVGDPYYLYVDGNGGASSAFYIEVESGVNSVCPTSCCPIIISGDTEICTGSGAKTYTQTGGVGGFWSVTPASAGSIDPSTGVFTPTSSAGTSNISATITYTDSKCSKDFNVTIISNVTVSGPLTASTCQGKGLTAITHTTSGATGIVPTTTNYGLPSGVTATFSGNATSGTITISGTPTTTSGSPFNYSIPLTGSCSPTSATGTITVNALPDIKISDGSSVTVCAGKSKDLTASGGATYTWSPATGLSSTTGSVVSANPTSTTKYVVIGKDDKGCENQAEITVNVGSLTINAGSDIAICSGKSATLSAVGGGSGLTWEWSTGEKTPSIIVSPTVTTTYEVTGKNADNCEAKASVKVTVQEIPVISSVPPLTRCSESTFSFTPVNGTNGTIPPGTTYSWLSPTVTGGSSGTNFTTISGKLTNTSNNAEIATYNITPKTSAGCEGLPFELKVTIDPLPEIPSITMTPPTCNSSSKATISNFVPSQTYIFSTPGPTIAPDGSINGMTLSQSYNVKTFNGKCESKLSLSFEISPQINSLAMPIIDTVVGNCVSIGLATIINYNPNLTYRFTPLGPSVNSAGQILDLTPGIQYSVTATENSCNSNSTPFFSIDPIIPLVVPSFFSDRVSGCTPLSYSLTASFKPGIDYKWYSNGSFIGEGSVISGTLKAEDCYDITLNVSNSLGCSLSETVTDMICAKLTPTADFSVNTTTLISSFQEISFDNNSQNASRYVWDFGNGDTSTLINPTYYYQDISKDINVRLFAYSANDCFDSSSILLRFIEDASFYIPNTFTPDKDEFNETWGPVFTQGYDPYYFELQVFNRWGEIIWESFDAKSRWNGTYGSTTRQCPDGVYIWKIICRPKETTMRVQLTGSIRLIR